MLIGVAGHVDHGKTALVQALTGVDADRLPEERRRGMTIDLGFAYAPMADGRVMGFVDLPGHERFLHNFLAGALALDTVLLVIAADEGPRPQTIEHLAILDRIGVERLVVAMSKADRVDPAGLAAAEQSAGALLANTRFAGSEIISTSSLTGEGVDALRRALEAVPERLRPAGQGFRMPIDRAFQLTGAGLVVTGSVAAGEVTMGQPLVLSPEGLPVRVRSLHVQNREQDRGAAGARCGVALAGAGRRGAARRGAWLLAPELHAPTRTLLVAVRDLPDAELRHGRAVRIHLAAEALEARVIRLAEGSAEAPYPVLLALERPTASLAGDRVALRDPAAHATLAAGRVLDPFPPERRRLRQVPTATLLALGSADATEALAARLAIDGAADLERFALARNMPPGVLRALPDVAVLGSVALTPERAAEIRARAETKLAQAHARYPDRLGLDQHELAAQLDAQQPEVAAVILGAMIREGAVRRLGGLVHLPGHRPSLAARDEALWTRLRPLLAAEPERPPTVAELASALELDWRVLRQALTRLAHFGRVVVATRNRAFLPEALAKLQAALPALAAQGEAGLFTVAAFNAATGVGRNLSVELLEYFDRRGVTRRLGDQRRLARPLRQDADAGRAGDDPADNGGVGVALVVEPRE
jgi:selenocysteine-specific elongation factor